MKIKQLIYTLAVSMPPDRRRRYLPAYWVTFMALNPEAYPLSPMIRMGRT